MLGGVAASLMVVDRTGTIVYVNEPTAAAASMQVQDMIGLPFDNAAWNARSWDGRPLEPGEYPVGRALAGEEVRAAKLLVDNPQRGPVALLASAVPIHDQNGEVEMVVATIEDVTDAIGWASSVEATQTQLAAVFEHALDGILLADDEGRYVRANPAICSMLGYSEEELLTLTVSDVVAPPLDGGEEFEGFRASGVDVRNITLVRSDGTRFVAETTAVTDVRPGVHLSILRDITERIEAERAVQEALKQQREAAEGLLRVNRLKDTFLSAVSHELRTPLANIAGAGETLSVHRERLSAEQQDHLVERVMANAGRLESLLVDLLDLSRLQRGVSAVDLHPVDLSELLEQTVAPLKHDSHELDVDGAATVVMLDRAKVERIVENLVANAIRHTPPGTRVEIGARVDGDVAVVVVEDNGPGMSADFRDKAFQMFTKGDTDHARASGTGIGLALVREFTELMGGEVEVDIGPLGGTRFVVSLPTMPPPD